MHCAGVGNGQTWTRTKAKKSHSPGWQISIHVEMCEAITKAPQQQQQDKPQPLFTHHPNFGVIREPELH